MTSHRDWWVAVTNTQREKRATQGLEDRGFGVWWPRRVMEFRSGRNRWPACRLIHAYPGYLFIRPTCGVTYHNAFGVDGVKAMIAVGEQPLRVPDEEVLRLMRIFAVADFPWVEDAIRVGNRVYVTAGPFEGLDAVVRRVAKGHAVVELDVMGRATPVEIARNRLAVA